MGASRIAVVAYNIHRGRGLDGRTDLPRIAAALAELEADVIVLNEVRAWGLAGGRFDQAARLGRELDMRVWWCAAIPLGLHRFGNALLARHARADVPRMVRLPWARGLEPRAALIARLVIGGRTWTVCGTHLDVWRQARRAQAAALARELARHAGPAVLAGDLNAELDSEELGPLADWAGGADRPARLPTFPADDPREQRDHVVAGPGCAIIRARTIDVPYSDHLPIVAEVQAAPEAEAALA